MRRVRRCAGRAELVRYQRIIEVYAPYVLIRCAAFTNSRKLSQEIGAYVLLCTCLMSSRLNHWGQVGIGVEVMLEVVGPDVVSRGEGDGDDPLIADGPMLELVKALNRMKRSLREVLVLRFIGARTMRELARLLRQPVDEITVHLARAEDALAKELSGAGDVQDLLAEFLANLDLGWILEVGCCAMEYLVAEGECEGVAPRCWLN